MNKQERVFAALSGEAVDQVPVSFWRHFHKQDQTPQGLASATATFTQKYDLDLVRLMPNRFYAIADWGAKIQYSKEDGSPSRLKKAVVEEPEDWRSLGTLSDEGGVYGQTLEAIKLTKNQLSKKSPPLFLTLYSPLTIAHQLAGEVLFDHLNDYSTDVHIGLATIAETISRFASSAISAGADGIFLTSEVASTQLLDNEAYQAFATCYDLIALELVKGQEIPIVLHLTGDHIHFEAVNEYPVQAICWQNSEANPSLAEARQRTGKTLMTGITAAQLRQSEPEAVQQHVETVLNQMGTQRFIFSPGSELQLETSEENLQAMLRAIKGDPEQTSGAKVSHE